MNECDVCGTHDGIDYTGTIVFKHGEVIGVYHLCETHYIEM